MNRSQSKIRHIQQMNIILEQRMLNEQNNVWLTYPNDKNYQYQKQNGKWKAKIIKTGKIVDMSKYPSSVANLEKQFPNGVAPAAAATPSDTASTVSSTAETTNNSTLTSATPSNNVQTVNTNANTVLKNPFQVNNPLTNSSLTQQTQSTLKNANPLLNQTSNQVQYKNESLPGSPVYYPWIHDGKFSVEKLTQSIEDNSIYEWINVLKKLTPEQFDKVLSDFKALSINSSLTTKKGVGVYMATRDVLNSAQKWIDSAQKQNTNQQNTNQQNNNQQNNNDTSGSISNQQNLA